MKKCLAFERNTPIICNRRKHTLMLVWVDDVRLPATTSSISAVPVPPIGRAQEMCPPLPASGQPAAQPVIASEPVIAARKRDGHRNTSVPMHRRPAAKPFKAETRGLFARTVELEYRCAEDAQPRGVPGLNASMINGCLRGIANRRAARIGLEPLYSNEESPFPWMSVVIDLKKERNLFEMRVVEHPFGGVSRWD